MNVSEAIERRSSARAFRADPVPEVQITDILGRAARSPSGGNLQPWRVHVLSGHALHEFLDVVGRTAPDAAPGYQIYPDKLWEPFRTRRFENGEQLYASIGVQREDKAGRFRQLAHNLSFFGAPVGLFVSIDKGMGPPQWADLGMFLQSVMLLATERGLDTCAQEFWTTYATTVSQYLALPDTHMIFCGLAMGYRDEEAPISQFRTARAPLKEWCELRGF